MHSPFLGGTGMWSRMILTLAVCSCSNDASLAADLASRLFSNIFFVGSCRFSDIFRSNSAISFPVVVVKDHPVYLFEFQLAGTESGLSALEEVWLVVLSDL